MDERSWGLLIVAAGALLAIGSGFGFRSAWLRRGRRSHARATIVSHTMHHDDGYPYYASRVRFKDTCGVEHETQGPSVIAEPPIGSTVDITYDSARPWEPWNGTYEGCLIPVLVLIAAAALLVAGLLMV